MGGLNNTFISHNLEAEKSEIMVLAVLLSYGKPLPGLQMAIFLLCPHMTKRGRSDVSFSSYKGTNLNMGAPPS